MVGMTEREGKEGGDQSSGKLIGEVVLATRQTRYIRKITRRAQEMSDFGG